MKHFFLAFTAIFFGITSSTLAQNIEKKWQFDAVKNSQGVSLYNIDTASDALEFNNGEFSFYLKAKDSLKASGNYLLQNNLLIFYYDQPSEIVKRFKITTLTDSTLVLTEKDLSYILKSEKSQTVATTTQAATSTIIPSEGFSMTSLLRGVLGMVVLIFLSFLLSSNRKAINWKTVGLGIAAQLILAIGVLKVPFVKSIFGNAQSEQPLLIARCFIA